METANWELWAECRTENADSLVKKYEGTQNLLQGVFDAEIILCCSISAIASTLWPGKYRLDRKRFVQVLIDYAPDKYYLDYISVPRLINWAKENGNDEIQREFDSLFPIQDELRNMILHTDQIDKPELEIAALPSLKNIEAKIIRKFSYANLIYTDLRSGLIHTYSLFEDGIGNLAPQGLSDRTDIPSYLNLVETPTDEMIKEVVDFQGVTEAEASLMLMASRWKTTRLLYFPYEFLRDMFNDLSHAVFDFWKTSDTWELDSPEWWIDPR